MATTTFEAFRTYTGWKRPGRDHGCPPAEIVPGVWTAHYHDIDSKEKLAAATKAAPIKLVPPFVSLSPSLAAGNATIDMCDVEAGTMYLGLYGEGGGDGCARYEITPVEFNTSCVESLHAPEADFFALIDQGIFVAKPCRLQLVTSILQEMAHLETCRNGSRRGHHSRSRRAHRYASLSRE